MLQAPGFVGCGNDLRINLDILNRDVDYSSIVNPVFELEDEQEEPALPSAWCDEGTKMRHRRPPPSSALRRALPRWPLTRPQQRRARRARRPRFSVRKGGAASAVRVRWTTLSDVASAHGRYNPVMA